MCVCVGGGVGAGERRLRKYDILFSVRSNFISLMITKSVIFNIHVDTPCMKMVFSPLVKILLLVVNSIYNTAKSNILYIFELTVAFH